MKRTKYTKEELLEKSNRMRSALKRVARLKGSPNAPVGDVMRAYQKVIKAIGKPKKK